MTGWHLNTNDQLFLAFIVKCIYDWLRERRKHLWELEVREQAKDDRVTIMNKVDANMETTVKAIATAKTEDADTPELEQRLRGLLDKYKRETCPQCPEEKRRLRKPQQ